MAGSGNAQGGAGARVRKQLTRARGKLRRDSKTLRSLYVGSPQPHSAEIDHAVRRLRAVLNQLRASVLAEEPQALAAQLTGRALSLLEQSLAKLAASSSARDPAQAVALLTDGVLLLNRARSESAKAGRRMPGGWPL